MNNEWISVEDRLPENDGLKLIYPRKYDHTARYNPWGEFKGKWTNSDVNGYEYEVGVTHWMPLPEPPKQEVV